MTQGCGDSSQGFANFLLFCVFTRRVREKYRQYLCGTNSTMASDVNSTLPQSKNDVHQYQSVSILYEKRVPGITQYQQFNVGTTSI